MNYRLLSKVFGVLLFFVAAAMLICLIYALLDERHPESKDRYAFTISAVVTFLVGSALVFLGRKSTNEVLRKEAIVVVGIGWLVSTLFGSLPYMLVDPGLSFPKAIFESASGFTTTGSTAIEDLDVYPNSLLLWRSLTQWLGGVGILVLFVAVLTFLGVGSKSLLQHESSIQVGDGATTRIRDMASRLWIIYIGLTLMTIVGLLLLGMAPFDAVAHGLTTAATAGFSPHNSSIAYYDSVAIETWLILCMFLASVSFLLYAKLLNGNWRRLRMEEEARYYLFLLLGAVIVIVVELMILEPGRDFLSTLREVAFPVVSIGTTTGYATTDYDEWPTASRMVLMVLMVTGGCAGSTAGGIKMSRVVLFLKVSVQELVRVFRPHQIFRLKINGHSLDDSIRLQTMFYLALVLGSIFFSTFVVAILEPDLTFTSAFGCTFATFFNIGPGFEIVGPTDNFAHMNAPSLLFLSLLMVMGRLELFAILVLFVPALWRRY